MDEESKLEDIKYKVSCVKEDLVIQQLFGIPTLCISGIDFSLKDIEFLLDIIEDSRRK